VLAYYVEWHMRKALAPILFDDEELDKDRKRRDPVLPARPSASAKRKKTTHRTSDGLEVQSFETLLEQLGTRGRHICRLESDPTGPTFQRFTKPTTLQNRALGLLELYPVRGKSVSK